MGPGLLNEVPRSHSDTLHSVGILWMSDRSVTETSTWQHTTLILTYSTVQSPSWDANWFAASQEILRISRNPKVHYRTHKLPPLVSILGQPNPVHIHTAHLLEIHPNIIRPSTPRSPQWFLPSDTHTHTHTTLIRYINPLPHRASNPQAKKGSGRIPTP